jgi:hypothetical protein
MLIIFVAFFHFFNGEGDFLRRGRLVYGRGETSTKGETRLQRGRFIYLSPAPVILLESFDIGNPLLS